MAETASPAHNAEDVGNAFVQQYYKVLLTSPDNAHKFYKESSVLGRPGPNGHMMKVTTLQDIEQTILSLDYKGCTAEINTVDAQDSCEEGVIVLVTGWLTGKENVTRSFTQTFLLAPQANAYYVLNDVFRFVDVKASIPSEIGNDNENTASAASTPKQESACAPFQPDEGPGSPTNVTSHGSEAFESAGKEDSADSESPVVKEVVSEQPLSSSQNDGLTVSVKPVPKEKDDPPKISYASIVAKESTVTSPVHTPAVVVKASVTRYLDQASAAPKASAPPSNIAPQNISTLAEVKAIYIGNLPPDISDEQLDEVLKKFGPIKKDGIQIRKYEDGFCYGFVEFVSTSSARSAIETHNIKIGSKESYMTEKKSTNQAGNGRGKFSSGRGDFRNDNYRNRENSGEGRSYGRYQNGNRDGEFGGQYRNPRGSNGEGRQRVYQNGGGNTPRVR